MSDMERWAAREVWREMDKNRANPGGTEGGALSPDVSVVVPVPGHELGAVVIRALELTA